jgi:hypothetical protein
MDWMVPYSRLQREVGWTPSSAAPAPGIELALRGIAGVQDERLALRNP